MGKAYTIHGVRQAPHRAREKFSDLLVDEVAQTLENPSEEEIERELIDLRLLSYCRSALNEPDAHENRKGTINAAPGRSRRIHQGRGESREG